MNSYQQMELFKKDHLSPQEDLYIAAHFVPQANF